MTDTLEPSEDAIMTQTDELREKVYNIVDAVAGGAEVTYANGHPRNPKLSAGATDAIMALMEQVRADALEPSAANTLSIAITYAKPK